MSIGRKITYFSKKVKFIIPENSSNIFFFILTFFSLGATPPF